MGVVADLVIERQAANRAARPLDEVDAAPAGGAQRVRLAHQLAADQALWRQQKMERGGAKPPGAAPGTENSAGQRRPWRFAWRQGKQ